MDTIKLKSAEELHTRLTVEDHWDLLPSLIESIDKVIKEAQRNAIEYTLKVASENAEADYNITESFDRLTGEDIEVYVINSSIIGLKETIFKDNNL